MTVSIIEHNWNKNIHQTQCWRNLIFVSCLICLHSLFFQYAFKSKHIYKNLYVMYESAWCQLTFQWNLLPCSVGPYTSLQWVLIMLRMVVANKLIYLLFFPSHFKVTNTSDRLTIHSTSISTSTLSLPLFASCNKFVKQNINNNDNGPSLTEISHHDICSACWYVYLLLCTHWHGSITLSFTLSSLALSNI